jgi:hypothetical protein
MGWFTRRNVFADPYWTNVPALAATATGGSVPVLGFPYNETIRAKTILIRLGNLVYRMEAKPCDGTACAAKWYLDNLHRAQVHPDSIPPQRVLHDRLRRALESYEARVGYQFDPNSFGVHVEMGANPGLVLYGPPFYNPWPPPLPDTPMGFLSDLIDRFCWVQVFT